MKKVLLFADIGGHEDDLYYHVGDEAMFYETYRWYREHKPEYVLTAFSWFSTHSSLEIAEELHLHWAKKHTQLYFPLLIIKLLLFRFLHFNFFSMAEKKVVDVVKQQDRVHFTGGGNISSSFRHWLYYVFFIFLIAKVYDKEIILTSQSLGPFQGIDRVFTFIFLKFPTFIGVRTPSEYSSFSRKERFFLPKLKQMLDTGYTLPFSVPASPRKKKKYITLGASIHEWRGYEKKLTELIRSLIMELKKNYSLKIIAIPHHIAPSKKNDDLHFMKKTLHLTGVKLEVLEYKKFIAATDCPAMIVKSLTAKTDLLLTSRYHGVVFALSANVPVIALQLDEYYQNKNKSALEFFYNKNYEKYTVLVNQLKSNEELVQKVKHIVKNNQKEKRILKQKNKKLLSSKYTLDSVLTKLRHN